MLRWTSTHCSVVRRTTFTFIMSMVLAVHVKYILLAFSNVNRVPFVNFHHLVENLPDEELTKLASTIFQIGLKHSSPKTLIALMPEYDNLTTEHIKSHLQKCRKNEGKSKSEFDEFFRGKMLQGFRYYQIYRMVDENLIFGYKQSSPEPATATAPSSGGKEQGQRNQGLDGFLHEWKGLLGQSQNECNAVERIMAEYRSSASSSSRSSSSKRRRIISSSTPHTISSVTDA